MKRNRILVACGTLALSVAAFLATKANKYAATQSAYFKTAVSQTIVTLFKAQSAGINMHLTTVANSGHTAFIKTAGFGTAAPRTLFANSAATTKLYYK